MLFLIINKLFIFVIKNINLYFNNILLIYLIKWGLGIGDLRAQMALM